MCPWSGDGRFPLKPGSLILVPEAVPPTEWMGQRARGRGAVAASCRTTELYPAFSRGVTEE